MTRKPTGPEGEDQAAAYLSGQGHIILARNWRYGRWEIDIISQWEDTMVFTEVKSRRSSRFGHPEVFVDAAKQDRIVATATAWLAQRGHDGPVRFDIVSITLPVGGAPIIHHIPDAFFPYH